MLKTTIIVTKIKTIKCTTIKDIKHLNLLRK